jgi:hypothetical protein
MLILTQSLPEKRIRYAPLYAEFFSEEMALKLEYTCILVFGHFECSHLVLLLISFPFHSSVKSQQTRGSDKHFAPLAQTIHLLQCLPYPSNRTLHSICYKGKERLANGKREFKKGKKGEIFKNNKNR